MPHFRFHLHTTSGLERDDIGLEFDSLEEAYLDVFASIEAISRDLIMSGINPRKYKFDITDHADRLLMDVPFSEFFDRGKRPLSPDTLIRLRKSQAEIDRTKLLIASIHEANIALHATLAETRRLLDRTRQDR